jgi:RNA 3'-terminal phosphate cyclase (ATP)
MVATIDGSQGEGGGQILRSSLALATITGTPVVIERVRANRKPGGLRPQHLTAVRAIASLCDAELEGDAVGSSRVAFRPKRASAGAYRFDIGTAGSASLVLQTVLYPLLCLDGESTVEIIGGTHNSMSPPYDFLARSFLPILRRMGANVTARIERHGFYPAGGGRLFVEIAPCPRLSPIELLGDGAVRARSARAIVSRLPLDIAERELAVLRDRLGVEDCRAEKVNAHGPGNAVMLYLDGDEVCETVTALGERGVRAERVAANVADEAERYLAAGAPVGEHLADQLLIPLALAGGGAFRTQPLSLHATTNIDVIARFLEKRPTVSPSGDGVVVAY